MRFKLSWTRGGSAGNTDGPSWHDVERELLSTLWSSGSFQLDVLDASDIGPVCLQVFADGGRFVLMLGENTADDYDVRTPYDPNRNKRMVDILGDEWDNRTLTQDRSLVQAVFREFFDTGNVSTDILT